MSKKRSNNANCFPHEMTFELDAKLLKIRETSHPFTESTDFKTTVSKLDSLHGVPT